MAGNDNGDNTSSSRRRRSALFQVGDLVEVNTKEEGLENVYFSATIIPPHKRSRKNIHVQYTNLLADESGSDKLKEQVKIEFVRPVPPSEKIVGGFEQDDVVDAFYKDGWWLGVVSRVVEAGNTFIVSFENPSDELEFNLDHLRPHWDWVHGEWRRPLSKSRKQFGVGRRVEVSFDGEDAWFPASIDGASENGGFPVEYISSKGEVIKANVDSLHLRPPPPLVRDKANFNLGHNVDAFSDFGWRNGVITEELENNRYAVVFKQGKLHKEFSQSELRAQMEWNAGGWLLSSHQSHTTSDQDSSLTAKRRLSHSVPKAALKKHREGDAEGVVVAGSVSSTETCIASEPENLKMQKVYFRSKRANRTLFGVDREEGLQELGGGPMEESPSLGQNTSNNQEESPQESMVASVQQEEQNADNISTVPSETHTLPFEKTNGFWQIIESGEVLQSFPQNPHFRPLAEHKIALREGLAIGHMLNFSHLATTASRLQASDPKSNMDDIMEALPVLETHGFNVSAIRERITELLMVKDRAEELLNEAKKWEDLVSVKSCERAGIEEQKGEICEQIKKWEEKLLVLESAKRRVDEEIAGLQKAVEENEKKMKECSDWFEDDALKMRC